MRFTAENVVDPESFDAPHSILNTELLSTEFRVNVSDQNEQDTAEDIFSKF